MTKLVEPPQKPSATVTHAPAGQVSPEQTSGAGRRRPVEMRAVARTAKPTDAGGIGAGNAQSPDSTGTTAVPATPQALIVQAVSASRISLAWVASPRAAEYAVFRSLDGATDWSLAGTVDGTQTTFVDDALSAGTTYWYRIAASSPAGHSPPSVPIAETTAPVSPTNVMAITGSVSTAVVSWAGAGGESGFTIMASSDGGAHYAPVGAVGPEASSFEVTGLSSGTTYLFEVIAGNASGTSAPSGSAAATTAPSAPAGLRAIANSPGKIDVSWEPAAGADSYEVQRSLNGCNFRNLACVSGAAAAYADPAILARTRYWYRVVAVNGGGASVPSTPADATALAFRSLGLVARTGGETEIALSWNSVPAVTGFDVQVSADGKTFAALGSVPAETTSFAAAGLTPGTEYAFRVVAQQCHFQTCQVVMASTAPEPPTNAVAAALSPSQVSISWSFATGARGYIVERSPDGLTGWAAVGSAVAGTTRLTDASVAAATGYFYRVLASGPAGNSAPSAVAQTATPSHPPVLRVETFASG